MTTGVCIAGTGVYTPDNVVTNEELCAAFNEYVRRDNARNADAIAQGERTALAESTPEFIVKASGIRVRRVHTKDGTLDPDRMCPNIPDRPDDEMSLQCEYAVNAARRALDAAGRCGESIDLVILASSNLQRMYPAVAMEVQGAIGARGFAYDMSVGCSSATFPIQIACDAIRSGSATRALLVNPELMSGHANWKDRDSHFIFGDAATAVVLERADDVKTEGAYEIVSTKLMSRYSSNIRNNGGYLNRCDPDKQFARDKLFYQQGRRVFKDVVPLASRFIEQHLEAHALTPDRVARYWLHQANLNMNELIARRLLGRDATRQEAPIVLDDYGNTASCGSIIAFHHHRADLPAGSYGVLCSFGAGYSIGSVIVRRR
jgi:beta-ketodecanoyl-[acyl-carrier-protein] synthase